MARGGDSVALLKTLLPAEGSGAVPLPPPPRPAVDAVVGDRAVGEQGLVRSPTALFGRFVLWEVVRTPADAVALAVGEGDAVRVGAARRRRDDRRSAVVGEGARARRFGRAVG